MDWEMVGVISGIIFIQGCIMIAAAKSIFVTQTEHDLTVKDFNSKLYKDGITIFVPREEWKESMIDRERRRDLSQRRVCDKMNKMQESMDEMNCIQNKTNESISHLLGRLEPYLKEPRAK